MSHLILLTTRGTGPDDAVRDRFAGGLALVGADLVQLIEGQTDGRLAYQTQQDLAQVLAAWAEAVWEESQADDEDPDTGLTPEAMAKVRALLAAPPKVAVADVEALASRMQHEGHRGPFRLLVNPGALDEDALAAYGFGEAVTLPCGASVTWSGPSPAQMPQAAGQ